MEKTNNKVKLSIWRVLVYFIIYSVIGYFLETGYGIFTKGVLESRKGFLYGPFCPIYGVGAVVMILCLNRFKNNNYNIFFGGFIVGSIIEYCLSLIGELFFKVKWWDYSNMFLNINGRICFAYSIFWGLLAIYLISHFNKLVDKFIEEIYSKFSNNKLKMIVLIVFILLMIDGLLTAIGLKIFFSRIVYDYNLDVENKYKYIESYNIYKHNGKVAKIADIVFSNEKMLKTFPNLKMKSVDGSIIYVHDILDYIQPYYFKFKE